MQGIYFLLSLIWLGVIIAWVIKNDRLKPGEPTQGLLRMERDTRAAASIGRWANRRSAKPPTDSHQATGR